MRGRRGAGHAPPEQRHAARILRLDRAAGGLRGRQLGAEADRVRRGAAARVALEADALEPVGDAGDLGLPVRLRLLVLEAGAARDQHQRRDALRVREHEVLRGEAAEGEPAHHRALAGRGPVEHAREVVHHLRHRVRGRALGRVARGRGRGSPRARRESPRRRRSPPAGGSSRASGSSRARRRSARPSRAPRRRCGCRRSPRRRR